MLVNDLEDVVRRVRPLRTIWLAGIAGVVLFTAVAMYLIRSAAVRPVGLPYGVAVYTGMALAAGLFIAPFVRRRIEKTPSFATRGEVARRWQTGWLVGQAIKEGVGLAGLVLALLIGAATWALAFGIASSLSMLMTPPWEMQLYSRLRDARPDSGLSR